MPMKSHLFIAVCDYLMKWINCQTHLSLKSIFGLIHNSEAEIIKLCKLSPRVLVGCFGLFVSRLNPLNGHHQNMDWKLIIIRSFYNETHYLQHITDCEQLWVTEESSGPSEQLLLQLKCFLNLSKTKNVGVRKLGLTHFLFLWIYIYIYVYMKCEAALPTVYHFAYYIVTL